MILTTVTIVWNDFDWFNQSCDKAPCDFDYDRNTEKYGNAMKLTMKRKSKSVLLWSVNPKTLTSKIRID